MLISLATFLPYILLIVFLLGLYIYPLYDPSLMSSLFSDTGFYIILVMSIMWAFSLISFLKFHFQSIFKEIKRSGKGLLLILAIVTIIEYVSVKNYRTILKIYLTTSILLALFGVTYFILFIYILV